MENIDKIELTAINMENLQAYSQMLHINPNTIINEALEQYFNNLHKKQGDENHHTNLDYDEFWDGVEL
jgi:hypothetical protein